MNRIPKPKPKVDKPVENETESNGDKEKSTDSSTTHEASQNDPKAEASNNSADTRSESHDEL